MNGTVETFIEMVFNYPTLSEIFKYAAYDALAHFEKRTTVKPEAAPRATTPAS